ncbi:MAG: hypothetical protein OXG44_11875 [Gammaproteobacteria bacterium]|nr:hypothetical protein [Gammaproteobacteria bacterium]
MPRYLFRCTDCGAEEVEFFHVDERLDSLGPCEVPVGSTFFEGRALTQMCSGEMTRRFGTGVQLRDDTAQANIAMEREMDRDIDAYRAMRAQGLQPHRIKGSDRLAAVSESKAEVEWGTKFLTDDGRRMADEVRAAAKSPSGAGAPAIQEGIRRSFEALT